MLEIGDPFVALDFDLAMSAVHRMEEQSQVAAAGEQHPLLGLLHAALNG